MSPCITLNTMYYNLSLCSVSTLQTGSSRPASQWIKHCLLYGRCLKHLLDERVGVRLWRWGEGPRPQKQKTNKQKNALTYITFQGVTKYHNPQFPLFIYKILQVLLSPPNHKKEIHISLQNNLHFVQLLYLSSAATRPSLWEV